MTISRWERGIVVPSQSNLVRLADVTGRDPAWFYADNSPKRGRRAA